VVARQTWKAFHKITMATKKTAADKEVAVEESKPAPKAKEPAKAELTHDQMIVAKLCGLL